MQTYMNNSQSSRVIIKKKYISRISLWYSRFWRKKDRGKRLDPEYRLTIITEIKDNVVYPSRDRNERRGREGIVNVIFHSCWYIVGETNVSLLFFRAPVGHGVDEARV